MSATIIAYTIVGSKVNRDDFFDRDERSVHGDCSAVGPGPRCQTCGKSIHEVIVTATPVEGFEPEGGDDSQGIIGGLSIIQIRRGDGEKEHFLGVASRQVWSVNDYKSERMNADDGYGRSRIRAVLDPLGLWDPDNFGIWTALYYS